MIRDVIASQGLDATVEYLQQLGPEYIDLILEFSKWVLKADKAVGFTIFTADDYPSLKLLPQVRTPMHRMSGINAPQDRIFEHLKGVAPDLVVPYLVQTVCRTPTITCIAGALHLLVGPDLACLPQPPGYGVFRRHCRAHAGMSALVAPPLICSRSSFAL